MAKLRIGIMLDPTEISSSSGGKGVDLAFLQDAVARRAQVQWVAAPVEGTESLRTHVPPRWAYKRSAAEDELKSTAYLACPRQPRVGWAYLNAVYGVVSHIDPSPTTRAIPARQIVFLDPAISTLFQEVHGLAEWVVNYDDLLDKRQLRNQGVTVIKYQRQRGHGRNLIVSSTSPLRILKVLVKRRLDELNLALPEQRLTALAERLINEASDISGDIVLRAARRGVFAGELIGVVLSKALALEEFGGDAPVGWFFLDDYAAWLGQREGRIADLLGMSPLKPAGFANICGLPLQKPSTLLRAHWLMSDGRRSSNFTTPFNACTTLSSVIRGVSIATCGFHGLVICSWTPEDSSAEMRNASNNSETMCDAVR